MTCSYCTDKYIWRAIYHDGSYLMECQNTGTQHHGFAEVDKDKVAALLWQDCQSDWEYLRIIIPVGTEPILFRRNLIRMNIADPNDQTHLPIIYALGWKSSDQECYLFGLPDGSVLVSPDRNAV